MTEAYEDAWLVRVRAQVMARDAGAGGWTAAGGGGLSHVVLARRMLPAPAAGEDVPKTRDAPIYEYFIRATRISDETEVLSCTIKRNFQYHKVMPTFHHWLSGTKRSGLTFQTAADARAFDRGVRTALDQLLDGLGGAWSSPDIARTEDDTERIFEYLNIPADSQSGSENSPATRPRLKHDVSTPILGAINMQSTGDIPLKQYSIPHKEYDKIEMESCPYVQLTVHEYAYPELGTKLEDTSSPGIKPILKRDSESMVKMEVTFNEPPLPDKKTARREGDGRLKCRHCHEWYIERENRKGSCHYAPDVFRRCIDTGTCIKCAQGMLYHCMSDAEGDFAKPCECGVPSPSCVNRWVCVTVLSLFVPCLCCYKPLDCMHRGAKRLHLAGGKHSPVIVAA